MTDENSYKRRHLHVVYQSFLTVCKCLAVKIKIQLQIKSIF